MCTLKFFIPCKKNFCSTFFCCIMILGIKSFLFAATWLYSKFCKIFQHFPKKNQIYFFFVCWQKEIYRVGCQLSTCVLNQLQLYTYNCLLILIYNGLGQNQLIINKYAVQLMTYTISKGLAYIIILYTIPSLGYPHTESIRSVSLYSRFLATVNLVLSLSNHFISHQITRAKAEY